MADPSWQEDHTVPEKEVDLEQREIEKKDNKKKLEDSRMNAWSAG